MKQKTRKILSRIGAGFMLGMSLFNFGAIWTRQQLGQTPRRAKNLKQTEKENLQQDEREMIELVEKNANEVMLSQQMQDEILQQRESQQQVDAEQITVFQKFLKYAAVSVWVISLGLIFSSVFADYPISFGKGILSVIPGGKQVAKISLEPSSNFFAKNEVIGLDLFLNSAEYGVESLDLVVKYDADKFEFRGFINKREDLLVTEVKRINEKDGLIDLSILAKENEALFNKKQKVAGLEFYSKSGIGEASIEIVQNKSVVAARVDEDGEKKLVNILGDTKSANFSILSESGKDVRCGKLTFDSKEAQSIQDAWENLLVETKLPKDALLWQMAGKERYFICGLDQDGRLNILVKSKGELKKAELFVRKDKNRGFIDGTWSEGEFFMNSIVFEVSQELGFSQELNGALLRFNGDYNWPLKGLAKFRF